MNNKGNTKVGRERVNITTDGALEIHQVNLSDTGQYMCTVKTITHSSPAVHHTTLVVFEQGKFKLSLWFSVGSSIKFFAPGCSNTTRSSRYLLIKDSMYENGTSKDTPGDPTGHFVVSPAVRDVISRLPKKDIAHLYNNQINARALIGQSAMVYCAINPWKKSVAS